MLGTLIRAGDVLDLFTVEDPEWGVTAVAHRLGIGKSPAHEALSSLVEIGLLRRVGHGRYRLGWRTMTLAAVLMRSDGLAACSRPVLHRVANATGMVASVVACERASLITVARQAPAGGQAPAPVAGALVPIDSGPAARVLLADLPSRELELLWNGGRLSAGPPASLAELTAELDRIRRCGWAQDEHGGVAAPIRDEQGGLAAILLTPCVAGRVDPARAAPLAVAAAAGISRALRARAQACAA